MKPFRHRQKKEQNRNNDRADLFKSGNMPTDSQELNRSKMDNDVISTDNFLKLKRALQAFQSRRINGTYKDIEADPEFAKIGNFFFKKLYASEDFSFRDTSMKKLHKALDGKIYKNMLTAVTKVIELHDITDAQDDLMVKKMIETGVDESMTMEQYQTIYVSLDNFTNESTRST